MAESIDVRLDMLFEKLGRWSKSAEVSRDLERNETMAKNIKAIAEGLRAQIVREVPDVGAGVIGAARLALAIREEVVRSLQMDAKKAATVAKSK